MDDPMDNMNGGDPPATNFAATLGGDAEVPPVETDTTGTATFQLSDDGSELSYSINITAGVGITEAHIHLGGREVPGGVVAVLFGPADPGVDIADGLLAEGVLRVADLVGDLEGEELSVLVEEMRVENTYANVHSDANAAGEVRGQIVADDGG